MNILLRSKQPCLSYIWNNIDITFHHRAIDMHMKCFVYWDVLELNEIALYIIMLMPKISFQVVHEHIEQRSLWIYVVWYTFYYEVISDIMLEMCYDLRDGFELYEAYNFY